MARESFQPMSDAQDDRAFEEAVARLPAERRLARRWPVLSMAVAALTLLVVGAMTSRFLARPKPLALSVEGAEMQKDGFVRASPEVQPSLRFSDGTRIGLGGVAAVRVRSIDVHGAHIAVENGEIRAEVIHAPLAAWVFDAGPFVVDVKGTTFSLAWNSVEARLVVRLETGLLAIHTPFTPEPISLKGGQRLVATSIDQRVVVSALTSLEAPGPTADEGTRTAPAPSAAAPVESAATPPLPSKPSARSEWAERFASGDFRSIVDDAEQQGLDAVLAQRGLEDLALLADAARYTGRTAVARRALLSQRERFGRSARAIDAAFMLGRLQESTDPDGAARWYDQYLEDAPRGTYAAEALGRKMMLVERLRGAAAARPIAQEYVKKYPRGPHAKSAQTILSSGTPAP
jgi:TolA-binding protein